MVSGSWFVPGRLWSGTGAGWGARGVPVGDGTDVVPVLGVHLEPVRCLLLTATTGGKVISWNVYAPGIAKIACAIAGRPLSLAEWQQYAGTAPPAVLPCQH